MRSALRQFTLVMMALLLFSGGSQAALSVAPVIIEAAKVQAGQTFEVVCRNQGEEEIHLRLSLALFDQDEMGSVVFLEDAEAVQKARDVLLLDLEELSLEPKGKETVEVRLGGDDFDHLYAVLFIQSNEPGVQIRFAVLFLLSTAGNQADVSVVASRHHQQVLRFTVENGGRRHGPWEGELHLFDSAGQLGEKLPLTSGLVLAGRSRSVEVSLPGWVERVEIVSPQTGRSP
jgi:hypothetical protein